MHGVPNGCGQDLGLVAIVVVHRSDLLNQIHSVLADVIKSPNERADQERAGFGGHERLQRLEAQSQIGSHPAARQTVAGSDAIGGAGKFDHDLLTDLEKRFGFFEHGIVFGGGHFRGDGSFAQLANGGHAFVKVRACLRDDGRVGGDTIQSAQVAGGTDFIEVGTIEVKVHPDSNAVGVISTSTR